jgi:hypothetical protein
MLASTPRYSLCQSGLSLHIYTKQWVISGYMCRHFNPKRIRERKEQEEKIRETEDINSWKMQ